MRIFLFLLTDFQNLFLIVKKLNSKSDNVKQEYAKYSSQRYFNGFEQEFSHVFTNSKKLVILQIVELELSSDKLVSFSLAYLFKYIYC